MQYSQLEAAETVSMQVQKESHLLIDAGISGKRIKAGLNEIRSENRGNTGNPGDS